MGPWPPAPKRHTMSCRRQDEFDSGREPPATGPNLSQLSVENPIRQSQRSVAIVSVDAALAALGSG